jgi:hypothetical protein
MTDFEFSLWLLVLCLVLGAVVTLSQLVTFGRRLWLDTRLGVNGAASVILRGTVRRLLVRLFLQVALGVQFGTRVFGVRSPEMTLIVVLIVVLALTADSVGEVFDYRVLRWILRGEDKTAR